MKLVYLICSAYFASSIFLILLYFLPQFTIENTSSFLFLYV